MHKYEVIVHWSEEDGVYVAEVTELPGCTAHGDSPDDALANCREAIELWFDTATELDWPIPAPDDGRR